MDQKKDEIPLGYFRDELAAFREEVQKMRGAMQSFSHDVNATSQAAEHNALMVDQILSRMDSMDSFVKKFGASVQSIIGRQNEQIRMVLSAFPEGDVAAHCREHASVIAWRETRTKLVNEILVKAAGAGVLAGTVWILVALWKAIKLSLVAQ